MNRTVMAFALVTAAVATSAPAGDTNPPAGPITGTMKTLAEVEPRTPIQSLAGNASATHVIALSGSYYLAGNIIGEVGKAGILVSTHNVTIDLNGFALIGVAGSDDGIEDGGSRRNISVLNGTIRDWGGDGVRLTSSTNSTLRELRAYSNAGHGLRLGAGGLVTHCVAELNGGSGIITSGSGTVSECVARANVARGFSPGGRSTVTTCTADNNGSDGFSPGSGSTISGCTATGNDTGISVVANVTVRDNKLDQNATYGIRATGSDNIIEGNHVTRVAVGLSILGGGSVVRDNIVNGNTDNYDFNAGTHRLEILLSEIPESIDWPCTVTLAGSLTGASGQHGITIDSDDVTIDLAGHALVGTAGSLDGINSLLDDNIRVVGGTVRDWGGHGIHCTGSNLRMQNVQASNNGDEGMRLIGVASVAGCQAFNNAGVGILIGQNGTITSCTARDNGASGIETGNAGVIRDCSSRDNAGRGMSVGAGGSIIGCAAYSNDTDGMYAGGPATIRDCTASWNANDGIAFSSDCYVSNNSCDSNAGSGIYTNGNGSRIDSNNVTDNNIGIEVQQVNNIIIRNTAGANLSSNYITLAGNAFGLITGVAAGDAFSSSEPWCNFSF